MKKFALVLFGFALGVAVMLPFVPEISFRQHTVDVGVPETSTSSDTFVVTHVVDGDTIDVTGADQKKVRVRFVGIDTPETVDPRKGVQCEGPEASNRMKALLSGKTVTLEKKPDEDKDDYGRLLRYVYLDGKDIGAQMLAEGYAESLCEKFPHPKCDAYDALEAKAKSEKLGRWGACDK